MNRKDFFYKQPVTESELDAAFDAVEQAMQHLMGDQNLIGIFQGGQIAQHDPTADLTVDASGPCYGYDANGQRLFFPGPTRNFNLAQDSSAVTTSVSGAGNEKWVSIFLKFARSLSDPRVDGNSVTVQFNVAESYEVVVVQGAEAPIGTATKPALDPDSVLLADVNRTNGQTQILDADIDIARRQDVFVLAGTPLSIRAGTPHEAVLAMLTRLNNHVNGTEGEHPSTAISHFVRTITGSVVADSGASPDDIVVVGGSPPYNYTLPDPTATENVGRSIRVIDETGACNTTTAVTIVRNGSEKIGNVASSYLLQTPYVDRIFTSDGTDWAVR